MVDGSLHSLLRERVRVALARGEDDYETILADARENLDGTAGGEAVAELVRAEFAAYRREQREWGGDLLDAERLLAAFRDLDLAGIVARADFTCCQSCGTSKIAGAVPGGAAVRGYVFCHRQDVDAAARGEGLFLSYGTFGDDSGGAAGAGGAGAGAAEIGERAVAALRGRGLEVEWDGEVTTRIHLPLTWRRRRYAHLAHSPDTPDTMDTPETEVPEAAAGARLAVTFCDYTRDRGEDDPVPMSFEEFRGLLYELVPAGDNFITCQGRSGAVVQGMWDEGPRFWLETPDPDAGCSYGRYATLDEAAEVVRVLAADGRIALTDLGELETVDWT
ncbi:hypothetical protein [Actinomadura sp. 21ATH]|uniref:DUF6891 domain-containing protein n=1 Tax=Actinomadura sp. 21ATH TaxID=1735444 RepID=UPI0035C0A72C